MTNYVDYPIDQCAVNEHPRQGSLLLFLARELPAGQSREIAAHLGHCWTCMAAAEGLKQGIQIFMESRDSLAFAGLNIPAPSVRALRERMNAVTSAREKIPRRGRALMAVLRLSLPRPIQIAAVFSLSVVAFFIIMTRPTSLNAAELLRRASASELAGDNPNRWVHHKVRIRSGQGVIDWEYYGAGSANSNAKRTAESAEWTRLLRGPMRWDDPLSIADFSHWRERQTAVQDSISESADRVTLTTTIGQSSEGIRSTSMTVRRADWHAIAKSVMLNGQTLVEATELVWEVRETPDVQANRSQLAKNQVESVAAAGKRASAAASSDFDRQLAEIRARDALFTLGVGLTGEEPGFTITSEPEAVTVEVAVQSAAREAAIRNALAHIPGAHANVLGPKTLKDDPANGSVPIVRTPVAVSTRHWTQPLLWDNLLARLGNAQAAVEYSGKLLNSAGEVRALIAQAHGLSARYPPEICNALSDETRSHVEVLAGKVMRALAQASDEYEQVLATGFARPATETLPPSTLPWQSRADRLFELVSERDRLMAKLFAVTEANNDEALTAEQALRDFSALNEQIVELAAVVR